MTNSELLTTVSELRELKNMADELAGQIDALETIVKQEMTNQGVDTLFIGTCKVSWKKYDTHRFDSKAFKAEHEELYEQYSKTVKASRFTIS